MLRGPATPSPAPAAAAARIDAPRRLALAACVGLFVALFLPWLSQTAVTRGLHGTLRLHQAMTGWQSLSLSAVVALVVALAVPAVLLGGAARPRARARRRLEGTIAAGAGALATITLLWTIAAHEGSRPAGPATLSDAIGWGMVLALACGLALAAGGAWTLRTARTPVRTAAARTRRARSPRR